MPCITRETDKTSSYAPRSGESRPGCSPASLLPPSHLRSPTERDRLLPTPAPPSHCRLGASSTQAYACAANSALGRDDRDPCSRGPDRNPGITQAITESGLPRQGDTKQELQHPAAASPSVLQTSTMLDLEQTLNPAVRTAKHFQYCNWYFIAL